MSVSPMHPPTNTGETQTKKHTMSSWLDSHDGRKTSLHPALVVKMSKISYTPENQQDNGKNNHEWICISH